MSLLSEVSKIEVPGVRNLEWYYHRFDFTNDRFKNMLTEGIKCRKLLGKKSGGNNGRFYISLTKDLGVNGINYAFDNFMGASSNFIISGINPVKCSVKLIDLYHLLAWSKIPLRGSGFEDEFQEYLKITPDKFVGIQCPLYNLAKGVLEESYMDDYYRSTLINLREMIKIMRDCNVELPIYDYSRRSNTDVHLIDQPAYLDKCDDMIEEVKIMTKSRTEESKKITFIV